MIPKIIHYCWFGGADKTETAKKCIKSWKKYCKKYEIIEWNESNFDLSKTPKFVQDAYEQKKWAFVTDYVRLKVVYDHGGIYFDTDVELLKRIKKILNCSAYFGQEFDQYVNTGLGFGAEKNAPILKELYSVYDNPELVFDSNNITSITCPKLNEPIFEKYGYKKVNSVQKLKDGVIIYPPEYFCPMDTDLNMSKTKNTISIHHFDASWDNDIHKKMEYFRYAKEQDRKTKIRRLFSVRWYVYKIIGEKNFNKLKKLFRRK